MEIEKEIISEEIPDQVVDENIEIFSQIALKIFEETKAGKLIWQKDSMTGSRIASYRGYLFLSLADGALAIMRLEKLASAPLYIAGQESAEDNIVHDSLTNTYYRAHYDVDFDECLVTLNLEFIDSPKIENEEGIDNNG